MMLKTLKWGMVRLAAVLMGFGLTQTVVAAELPADYTRLDYIESTGTQWIDTGHTHTATTRVDCVINVARVQVKDAAAVFGSFNGSKAANNFCFFSTYAIYNGDRPGYGRTGVETSGRGFFLGEKIRLVCEGLMAKWWVVADPAREGALYNTGTLDAGACTLAIFNIHNMTQVQANAWEVMKLYSFKIYEGESLVCDFVPVRRASDGVLGVYDLVTESFKVNSGTGTFVAGDFSPVTGADFTKTGVDRTVTTGVALSGALTIQEGTLVARAVQDTGAFTCNTLTLAGGTLDFAVRGEGTPEIKVAGAATVTGAVTVKVPESLAVGTYPIVAAGSFTVTGGSVTLDPACVKAGGTERRLETTAEGLRLVVSTPLPAGYTRLEYIESTGSQWIDTGYIHQANTRVECVIASHWQMGNSAHTYAVAFGSFNGSKNTSAFCFFTHWGTGWSGANKPATCRTGVETAGSGFFFDQPTRLVCEGTKANWSLVEEPSRTGAINGGGTANAGAFSMYIFVIHSSATGTASNSFETMRLYSFDISEGDATNGYTLKRSYIPALREADHAIGLFDTVTQTFTPDCSGGVIPFIGAYPNGISGVDYMKTGGDRVIANGVTLSGALTLAGGTLAVAETATQKIRCQTLALAGGTLDFATLGVGTPEIQVAGAATISGAVTVTLPPALAPGVYNLITADSLAVAEGAAVTLAEGAAVGSDGATRTLEVTETGVRIVVGEQALPAGYARLAGVRSTGTQWIDTGLQTYELTSIDFSYSDDSYAHTTAFFGQDAWTGSRCLFNQQSNLLYFHDFSGVVMGPAPGCGQRHRFLLGADARARPSTNDAEPAVFAVRNAFGGANRRLAIFGTTAGTYLTRYTFNEMRIADAGVLKRYFVPCLNPQGEAGLWDFVEGLFYGNRGSGVLLPVYGGAACLNYVQSNSRQCVLVDNYTMDANTTVLMNFAYPVYQASTAFFGIGWSGNQYLFNQQNDLFTFHSGGQNLPAMGKPDATAKYQVEVNNANAFIVRNLTAGTSASASIVRTVPASPLSIFSINTGANASSFRFYDMEIGHAEGNGVVTQRRIFPYRNDIGVVGLRDELTGAFYLNRGTEPLAYGYAYNTTENGVVLYDGEIVAEDRFPTANVVKTSPAAIKAGVVTDFLSLNVEEGVFDLADGMPRTAEVAGALTLAGGTRLRFDAADAGNDTLAAASVALVNASAETPVVIEIVVSGSVSFGEDGKVALISGGLTAADADKFKLEGLNGTLLVEGGALKATLPADVVVSAVWTGSGDRTNLADTRNWQCRNVLGETMPNQLPTADSYVIVGTNTTFCWPAGQTLTCRKVVIEDELKLNADCDWRGLPLPISFKVDLNGHKLYLSNLQGRGEITDSTRPCEYQRLEFIASTAAGQWIDTGYCMKAKTKFECAVDVSLNQPYTGSHGYPEIFGVINGQDRVVFFPTFGNVTDGALTSTCCLNRGGNETKKGTFYNGEKMKLTVQGTNAYFESLEGTGHSGSVTGVPVTPGASQYNIFIFTAGKGGTSYDNRTCAMNLYSFKIWDDGDNANSLVRDFVPVRRTSDGEIGLLDLVNNEFHGNGNRGTIAMKGGGVLAGEIDCCGEVHLDVSEGLTIGTDAVKLTGSLRLVKEGLGTFHPTITGSTYYGGTEVAAGRMTAWQDAYPASADKTVTISSNAVFDINGLWQDARGCASEAMYELNGGTVDNLGVDCSEAWGSMMNMRLTADSTVRVSHTYGFIAGSYMMTFIDLCDKRLTIDIADGKTFWLFNTSIYNGTLSAETPSTGKLWFNKYTVRAYTADFDLNCGIQIDVPVDVKDLTMRYAGTTASGSGTLTIHGTYKPVSDFIYNFKMLNGTKLDLTAQEGVFALTSPTTGKTLAFADNATIAVDMGTRRIPAEGRVVAWENEVDKPTNNVKFVAPSGARYRVYTKDDGIYVMSGMIITIR